jgi:hypothetical protein
MLQQLAEPGAGERNFTMRVSSANRKIDSSW